MKEAFIKLHLSILIAGGTGIFGKLISLNEGLLVWYRMMFASVMFFLLLSFLKKLRKVTLGDVTKIGSVGLLLALHWIFFYGSIKASNVSIGVVCLSLMSIFTAIFEPLINRHRISLREILFSLVAVLGIVLIFHFDTRYRVGICMGVISSALASLFTIVNKKVAVNYTSSTMLIYEMLGGFLGISCILPFYLHHFPVSSILPGAQEQHGADDGNGHHQRHLVGDLQHGGDGRDHKRHMGQTVTDEGKPLQHQRHTQQGGAKRDQHTDNERIADKGVCPIESQLFQDSGHWLSPPFFTSNSRPCGLWR